MFKLPTPTVEPYGDAALYLQYPSQGYSEPVNNAVLEMAARLRKTGAWIDVISGYDSLVASFDPHAMTLAAARKTLNTAVKAQAKRGRPKKSEAPKIIEIPVHYGGENGPDMGNIMKRSGLSAAEIIALHSAQDYRVCMMGFVPGFTFLSEAPSALHHLRHETPRLSVPAGSVGIAGWQTGIYGLSSPGGWQIIGRTDSTIFDAARDEPFLLGAGDGVRFVPAKSS